MPIISFDRAVDYYDDTRGFPPGVAERIRDSILHLTGATANTRFIEPGIGTGRVALPFVESGYVYDGVDISTAMMRRLDQKIAEIAATAHKPKQNYHCELIQANITESLPFKDGTYDVIVLVHVLHLVEQWRAVLTEARRVLKPTNSWMLISQTERWKSSAELARKTNGPISSARLVRTRWREILRELGEDHEQRWHVTQIDVEGFLQSLGAKTQALELVEYQEPAISPRMMAERLKGRMYSGDWNLSDDVHAEAIRRLEKWLAVDCPEPDVATVGKGSFTALAASWSGQ